MCLVLDLIAGLGDARRVANQATPKRTYWMTGTFFWTSCQQLEDSSPLRAGQAANQSGNWRCTASSPLLCLGSSSNHTLGSPKPTPSGQFTVSSGQFSANCCKAGLKFNLTSHNKHAPKPKNRRTKEALESIRKPRALLGQE